MEELTMRIREITNIIEEAYDMQDWTLIEESLELLNSLYDYTETNSGDYDLDME